MSSSKPATRREDASFALTASARNLLVRGSDVLFRELVHHTLAFAVRLERVRNQFGQLIGLSGHQYTILISIARLQGASGVGVNAVAKHLHLSGAFTTIEVNRLVALGLVSKRTHQADRRRVLLRLTKSGRTRLAQLTPHQVPANDLIFGAPRKILSPSPHESDSITARGTRQMGERVMGQMGFFDVERRLEAISAKGDPLETIKKIVPWEDFRTDIEAVTETKPEERKSNAGRKPYDAILKFKILVLQSLHNLSDEQTEYLIRDRMSFMRFLDLGLEDPVPDATTIWLFREALAHWADRQAVRALRPASRG
jgi:DNA-binding MarR family transcriptional regulator